ncbi:MULTISPECIES: hypothetical protein [Priestia]|uniref:hypothetical protein n=1 Tax=Priestia TaxID=2800373 RepID=UPI001CFF4F65|nr:MULTISPECIES: hypothetical protein [Priestia]WJD83652.1 hypothetical protein QRD24_27555 [Priestia megaterium]
MSEKIKRLYDEMHAPKLTPYELIENLRLPNYSSVDFSKDSENNIIAYTKCVLEDGNNAMFKYIFDVENKLVSLTSIVHGVEEEVYNRKKEVEKFYLLASQSLIPSVEAI